MKLTQKKIVLTLFIIFTLSVPALWTGCSSLQKLPPEMTENPEKHDLETVVIMGINDFHGFLTPRMLKTRDPAPVEYERGGASILAAHVRILRSQFRNRFLLVDAGDEFQGSIESNWEEGAPVVAFFNLLKLHAAAIGNHEFDFGPAGPDTAQNADPFGALKARLQEAHYPYVAANIFEKKTGQPPPFPNTLPSFIIKAGRVHVGVIGLTTRETPVTTRSDFVQTLDFTDLKEATLREAARLRAQGVEIILIVAHVGLLCKLGNANPMSTFRKPTDPLGECNPNSEMVQLLNSLPPGTVDAVVSGHTHQIIHHWIRDIPVIQGGAYNQYYNLIYLTYDWTKKELLRDRTRIEGPVPICPKVFEHQGDCNGDKPAPKLGRGELVTPRFHGVQVEADSETEDFLKPVIEKSLLVKSRVLTQALRPITHNRTAESELGNLIADRMRQKVNADVAVMNPGGIRASFEQGAITYEALFRALPFDNMISLLKMTGRELKLLLRLAESGMRGYYPVSGVTLKLIPLDQEAPSSDLNKNGKIETWEVNRLVSATFSNGAPILDQKQYTVATVDFLVLGGDDLGWIMSQIPKEQINLNAGGLLRNAVEEHLINAAPLNSVAKPLVSPKKPRFIFKRKTKSGLKNTF